MFLYTLISFWFIPIDILSLICIIFGMVLGTIFLIAIILDKSYRTVPMMLITNTCLAEVFFGIILLSIRVFALENDLKQIEYKDLFCNFRSYIGYVSCSVQNCSYLLQSIYRFVTIVYPSRLFCQSMRFQFVLICLSWIFAFIYPIAFLFNGQILYNVNNQICQLPLRLSFSIIYMASCAYIIPVFMTIFIYFKLVRYVKQMSKRVTPVNTLSRVRRELKMVRRTVILVAILFTLCFPYAMFILLSFFMQIPIYHFRIAYICIDVSYALVMIVLFQFTDSLKTSIIRRINKRPNMEIATVMLNETRQIHNK
jgi:hypothetical protein